jgi:FtsH-binding integral membrane protein
MKPEDFYEDIPLWGIGCLVVLGVVVLVVAEVASAFIWFSMYKWIILGR